MYSNNKSVDVSVIFIDTKTEVLDPNGICGLKPGDIYVDEEEDLLCYLGSAKAEPWFSLTQGLAFQFTIPKLVRKFKGELKLVVNEDV